MAENEVNHCLSGMWGVEGLWGSSGVEYKGFPQDDGSLEVGIEGEH